MTKAHHQNHLKHFDKFNFVEAFIAASQAHDPKIIEEKKREAVIIAEAIEENQSLMLENLATKQDLAFFKASLEQDFKIMKLQLVGAIATLIVFLPPFVEVIKKMFGN